MEPENLPEERIEQHSRLHQVTPLSKYLAMVIFVIMPFIGGYVGYQFAPEKVVEIVKNVEIDEETKSAVQLENEAVKKELKIVSEQEDLTWHTEMEISLVDNRYTRAVAAHRGLTFDDFIEYANTNGFFMRGRVLSKQATQLVICDRCTHGPSAYYIFDEIEKKITKAEDWNGVPFEDTKKWFRFNEYERDPSNTLLVSIGGNEVKVYDFASDRMKILYEELAETVTLCGAEAMSCGSGFILTREGEIGFGRYDASAQPQRLIDVKIVQIPDSFK